MAELRSFRIYPERHSNLHFRVRIYSTVADLRQHGREMFQSPAGRALGWCGSFTVQAFPKGGKPYTRPLCGEILLARRRLTNEIISHECTHAALGYARRRRFDFGTTRIGNRVGDGEERFCGVQGRLVRQIVARLFQYNFLKESASSDGR